MYILVLYSKCFLTPYASDYWYLQIGLKALDSISYFEASAIQTYFLPFLSHIE